MNLDDPEREVTCCWMEIKYQTKQAEKLCTDFDYAKRKLPKEVAEKLQAHINYIERAICFNDIMAYSPFKFHKLSGDRKDTFALDVGRKLGYRLLIEPLDENKNNIKKEKDIEKLKKCTKIILVVEVTNHYD